MKQLIKIWMLSMFTTLGIISCTDSTDNPVTPSEPVQPALADYTIIFYGHGGGNLDAAILTNIRQFYLANPENYQNVKVAVQYKYSTTEHLSASFQKYVDAGACSQEEIDNITAMGSKTCRFVVDTSQSMEAQQVNGVYGEANCDIANPDSLTHFINWAANNCPAKNYVLILSDHGGGYTPHSDLPMSGSSTRGIVFDDGHSNNGFTVHSLTSAIRNADIRPAVVYMDACLMNSVEYLFELKDLCDYVVASTYVVPGPGGEYTALVNQFSSAPDIETALSNFCEASVANWDKLYKRISNILDEGGTPVSYYDMTVTRTKNLDAFGAKFRQYVDVLLDAYQNGGDDIRKAIDECTEWSYKAYHERPYYDLPKYLQSICDAAPAYFPKQMVEEIRAAFNNCIVKQSYSEYLTKWNCQVDYSILLGYDGKYEVRRWSQMEDGRWTQPDFTIYSWDGTTETWYYGEDPDNFTPISDPVSGTWASTGTATYEQLAFDRIVGWSRWLKVNQQPAPSWSAASMNFDISSGTIEKLALRLMLRLYPLAGEEDDRLLLAEDDDGRLL